MARCLEEIADEAAAWVARMDAGDWDHSKEAELQAWLNANPQHRGALLRAQAAWMTLDNPGIKCAARPVRLSRRFALSAAAAALAASFAGGLVLLDDSTSFSTKIGEIRRVPLADGSIAALNTASKLKVKLADSRREVRIERGEAWFQVAKDSKRPFLVEAGRVRVLAIGTAFSVRKRQDGAEIRVTEGVVEMWVDGAREQRRRLFAGQLASIADDIGIRQESAQPSSVDRALAWRNGKIDLVGEPLGNAAAEFNRYNQRRIVIVDPAIAHEQFDGVFRIDDQEGFAIAVKNSLDVPVDFSTAGEIRIGRPQS